MKKYNLSKIMKRAWELVKGFGFAISEGLKKAWREAKEMKELKGSPKQVAWAEDIRKDAFDFINGCIENNKKKNEELGFGFFDKDIKAYEACLDAVTDFFNKVDDASVVINNRYNLSAKSLMEQCERYKRMFLK